MSESEKTNLTPDFSHLILSIASAALLKMGLDPQSEEKEDRNMARYNIDLLSILKEKTKNNLTEKETRLLDSCIHDLQLKFIQTEHKSESTPEQQEKEPSQKEAATEKQEKEKPQDKSAEKTQNDKESKKETKA
ncbi:MAG: DUF1844 domain-containing protein [Bdellovibrionales bacterium]|nr:DUF1844 domain-containing protein [Bdellovibrionales bacterium]